MENENLKLRAPRAINKARSFNSTKNVSQRQNFATTSNFDFSMTQKSPSNKLSKKLSKESTAFDLNDIEKDFEELEVKSEIFNILKSNTGDFFKNSSYSRSTAFSRIHNNFPDISDELEDFEKNFPPRSKNPLTSSSNLNDSIEEEKNLQINFAKFFLKY
jgi:hypothetical protein